MSGKVSWGRCGTDFKGQNTVGGRAERYIMIFDLSIFSIFYNIQFNSRFCIALFTIQSLQSN